MNAGLDMSSAQSSPERPLSVLLARVRALLTGTLAPEASRLAEALGSPLDLADLASWTRFSEDRYTRNLVARGEGWELRLLCWMPGQRSALHGHGRSACAFRVISGAAEELRLGAGRRVLQPGAIVTAGEDEVHQVGNAGAEPLITLHLYAPPLPVDQPSLSEGHRIVILGGGFCGTALAIHLLRQGGADLRISLVERGQDLGRGVAYGTRDPAHLLNVPASKMSLDPKDPEDFLRFARERGIQAQPTNLLPRALYGDYVGARLAETVALRPGRLRVAAGEAVAVEPEGVRLSDGRWLPADAVVLATGHLPPRAPEGLTESAYTDARVVRDAWDPGALDGVAPEERVLVVGMGLTAVDVLLSLRARRHRGRVTVISRHGRWPEAHLPGVIWSGPAPELAWPAPTEARALARWLDDSVAESAARGVPWQAVIDAFRPRIPEVWAALPAEERAVFLSRYRARWELYRHRAPASSLAALAAWQEAGDLDCFAAEIEGCTPRPDALHLHLRTEGEVREVAVDRLILATGADTDLRRARNRALQHLLESGRVRVDAHGLGLEVDEDGCAIGVHGEADPGLWVLGAARRPRLWETTAVPELSRQAAALARTLLAGWRPGIAPQPGLLEREARPW